MPWHTYDNQVLPEIKQRSYHNQAVVLDGASYQQCTFNNCHLIYRGGPCRMASCYIGPGCSWQFENEASYVLQFLQEIGWQIVPPAHLERSQSQ